MSQQAQDRDSDLLQSKGHEMKRTPAVLLFASASIMLSPLPAGALVTSTKAITCSSTTKLQSAIDAVPAGTVATFKVTGTCNENITVPQGKTITSIGATAKSRITAANGMLPAVTSRGNVTLQKMILTNASGAADTLVETDDGGILRVISSDLSAPSVDSVVGAWSGELRVSNSRVVGGQTSGIEAWGATTLVVEGTGAYPAGPTRTFETYVKSPGAGIGCGQGASLRVQAKSSGGKNGVVTIEKSKYGVGANFCVLTILNKTSNRSLLRIRNNVTGVVVQNSSGQIDNALITDNTGANANFVSQSELVLSRSTVTGNQLGLGAQQSQVRIDASTFSNVTGDLQSSNTANVDITSFDGASSFPKALTWANGFSCWSGGRIDLRPDALTTPLGGNYSSLGCLYID